MKKIIMFLAMFAVYAAIFAQGKASIAVPAPKGVNLGADADWIPVFIQGTIMANFQQYSGLTVIDRQNADMVKAEQRLSESAEFDEKNAVEMGKMTNARLIVTGNILAKSNAYALTFSITDVQTGETKASASVPNCLRSALEDGSAVNRISYDLMTSYGIALGADAKAKLTQAAKVMAADTSAQVSVAKGIVAANSGSNIEALTYYIQARKNDRNFAEAVSRMSTMTTVVANGTFGVNAKNLIKLRDDWDKLLREAAELIAANPPEFEVWYFTDIEMQELTAKDYQNGTMSFTVSLPRITLAKAADEKIANELMTGMKKIAQSKNWGDKMNGFPWTYADDIPGDNWLKLANAGRTETYPFSVMLLNSDKKAIAKQDIFFELTFEKKYSGFQYKTSQPLMSPIEFKDVPVNDADTDKLYIAVENTGSKKLSVAPVYGMPVWKAIEVLKSGKHNGTVKIGGLWWGRSLNDIILAVKSSKKNVALDLTGLSGQLTEIKEGAFKGCTSLTGITIPEGVTEIGHFAFDGCKSLARITIPASVKRIDFLDHDKLKTVRYTGTFAQWCQLDNTVWCLYRANTVTLSDVANLKTVTALTIPDGVTRIGNDAFCYCSELMTVTIPEGVTEIGYSAFGNCTSLASITIPASVTTIKLYAFNGCKSLKNVYYAGSKKQWKKINIQKEYHGNDPLLKAKIEYGGE